MKIRSVRVVPATFPLRATFRTNLGQKNITKNVLFHVECDGGVRGTGEASSSLAMPEATQQGMTEILKRCEPLLIGQPLEDWEGLCRISREKFSKHPTAISALECALLDAHCKSSGIPLRRFFGNSKKPIETFYTLSALDLKQTLKIASGLARKGFRKFKIKLTGENPERNLEKIERISGLAPQIQIIADANQGWNDSSALVFVEAVEKKRLPVKLIEQPLPKADLAGMARVKKRSSIPIAADESLRTLQDLKELLDRDAADVFNIKIAKIGLLDSLNIARKVLKAKKKLMIGCMMESALGLAASVHWAIGSGIFDFVDLDSFLLLKPLNQKPGFKHKGPRIYAEAHP